MTKLKGYTRAYAGGGKRVHYVNGKRTLCGAEFRPTYHRGYLKGVSTGLTQTSEHCDCQSCLKIAASDHAPALEEVEATERGTVSLPYQIEQEAKRVRFGVSVYTAPDGTAYEGRGANDIAEAMDADGWTIDRTIIPF